MTSNNLILTTKTELKVVFGNQYSVISASKLPNTDHRKPNTAYSAARFCPTHTRPSFSKTYFTLLELIIVLLILGIMASSSLLLIENKDSQVRYDATKDRLQEIRYAIAGNPEYPNRPYFLKDVGRLPYNLKELVEEGTIFSWDQTRQHGWRGPYLAGTTDSDGTLRFRDGWENDDSTDNFGWNVILEETKQPDDDINSIDNWIIVQSYGSDESAGDDGSGDYAADYPLVSTPIIESPANSVFLISRVEFETAMTEQFTVTQERLSEIKTAIIGSTNSASSTIEHCYYADMGRFPDSINELLQRGKQPAWSDAVHSGWRGPYLNIQPDKDNTYRFRDGFNSPWDPTLTDKDETPNLPNEREDDDPTDWGWKLSHEEDDDHETDDVDDIVDWFHVQCLSPQLDDLYPDSTDYLIIPSQDLPGSSLLSAEVTLTLEITFPADFSGDIRACLYNPVIAQDDLPGPSADHTFTSDKTAIALASGMTTFTITLPANTEIHPFAHHIAILDATNGAPAPMNTKIITEYDTDKELNYSYKTRNLTIETQTLVIDL